MTLNIFSNFCQKYWDVTPEVIDVYYRALFRPLLRFNSTLCSIKSCISTIVRIFRFIHKHLLEIRTPLAISSESFIRAPILIKIENQYKCWHQRLIRTDRFFRLILSSMTGLEAAYTINISLITSMSIEN